MDDSGANSQSRNVTSGCGCGRGCVHDLDRETMKRLSLGSQNLTKLNRMTSNIFMFFPSCVTYGSSRKLIITKELAFI